MYKESQDRNASISAKVKMSWIQNDFKNTLH